MCGIAGIFGKEIGQSEINKAIAMSKMLVHRGPDDDGIWVSDKNEIVLVHRRLSILDLSENGKQPMVSKSQRYVMSYNGEIYNCREMAIELEDEKGITFIGTSDTEILLSYFEEYGVSKTLQRCRGMFAIALYDRVEQLLYLIRDRMGEKPLFYEIKNEKIFFASELKCLEKIEDQKKCLNYLSVDEFIKLGYITGNKTIYEKTFKVRPGEVICLNRNGKTVDQYLYWNYKEKIINGKESRKKIELSEAVEQFEEVLLDTVSKQMISDVPLGAFLSSGVDSTLIVSMMQKINNKVKTFTIGVEDNEYNEAKEAKKIAEYLETDHTEMYVTENDIKNMIPKLSEIYSEPFGDISAIPTLLVSKLAKSKVTVALTGDGGDELFGGYPFYQSLPRKWNMMRMVPVEMRKKMGENVLRHPWCVQYPELIKRGEWFQAENIESLYSIMKYGPNEKNRWCLRKETAIPYIDTSGIGKVSEVMMYLDAVTYLPEDILVKTDRAAMHYSLETRAPLLDKEVIEFAGMMYGQNKIKGKEGKRVLRKVLYKYVPSSLLAQKKKGFSVPISRWLIEDQEMNEWANSLLDVSKIRSQDILNTDLVSRTWKNYLEHKKYCTQIWNLLMFEQWCQIKNY